MRRRKSSLLLVLALLLTWAVAGADALELRGFPSSPDFFTLTMPGQAAPDLSPAGKGRFYFDSDSNTFLASQNAGGYVTLVASGGNAPADGKYIVQALHAGLSAEQSLGALTTGLTLNTVAAGTGVLSAYAGTSCINQFPRSLDASGAATCATVANTDLANSTITIQGSAIALGGSTLATTSTPQFSALGLGGAAGAASTWKVYGVTSGSIVFTVPAIAGTNTVTFPAGTTDFTATGATGAVVRQSSAGAALTVSALTLASTDFANQGTTTTLLHGNASGNPSFGAVALTADVSGQLPLANGGTAANLTASNGGIFYSTASAGAILAGTATAGQMLQSGASTTPAWSTATFPATATGTGTLLRANGTNWVASTTTIPDTFAISTIPYASSANVLSALATANYGVLNTSSSGVPSVTASPVISGNITSGVAGVATGAYLIKGATSGTFTLTAAAAAGTVTWTMPTGGSTDFSATGGTSQVLQQTSAGGALTVGQLAASNLSNGTTGSGGVVLASGASLVTPTLGVASATSLATSAATPLLLTNGQLVNIALTSQTVGATTLTIPDFASVVDEFTFKTKAQTMSNKTFVAPVLGAATGTSFQGIIGNVTPAAGTFTLLTASSATFPVLSAERTSAAANTALVAASITHKTSVDMVDGHAVGLSFRVEDDTSGVQTLAAIYGRRTGADNTGRLDTYIYNAGVGTLELSLDNTSLNPATNDGLALGTTALGWADLHLATGGVINWANGNATLTHATGALSLAGANFTVSAVGPHAIGGATATDWQLRLTGTASGVGSLQGFVAAYAIDSTLTPADTRNVRAIYLAPTITEAGAGNHPDITALYVAPIITAGAATLTNFYGVQIEAVAVPTGTTTATGLIVKAPTGATNNYAAVFTGGNVGIGLTNPYAQFHAIASNGDQFYITTSDFTGGSGVGSALNVQFGAASGNTYTSLRALSSGWTAWNNLILQLGGGNVGIATSTFGTSAAGVLAFGTPTAPSTSPADVVQLYECDVQGGAGEGGLCIRDESGVVLKAGNGVFHVGAAPGLSNSVTVCSSGACVTTCTLTFTGGILTTKGANCG